MKQITTILLILLCFSFSCKSQSCTDLPDKFVSYSEAISAIQDAEFKYTDKLPSGKSSWIATANYYSCDGKTGYLVYSTNKGKEYIHEGVSKNVWIEFKTAPSSGSYYVYNIKNNYRLVPE